MPVPIWHGSCPSEFGPGQPETRGFGLKADTAAAQNYLQDAPEPALIMQPPVRSGGNGGRDMRAHKQGAFIRVDYTANDAEDFASRWPGSTVKGAGSFIFDAGNGDLTAATGTATRGDGEDWRAFSEDCWEFWHRLEEEQLARELYGKDGYGKLYPKES